MSSDMVQFFSFPSGLLENAAWAAPFYCSAPCWTLLHSHSYGQNSAHKHMYAGEKKKKKKSSLAQIFDQGWLLCNFEITVWARAPCKLLPVLTSMELPDPPCYGLPAVTSQAMWSQTSSTVQWNTTPRAGCIKCASLGNKCGVNVSCLLWLKVFFVWFSIGHVLVCFLLWLVHVLLPEV